MQSKATTVAKYLAELPEDRRAALASQKNYMSLYLMSVYGDRRVTVKAYIANYEAGLATSAPRRKKKTS